MWRTSTYSGLVLVLALCMYIQSRAAVIEIPVEAEVPDYSASDSALEIEDGKINPVSLVYFAF